MSLEVAAPSYLGSEPPVRDGGEVVVFEGHVASGKTTLLNEFTERAVARGGAVLQAAAAWTESEFQFGVIRQLFARAEIFGANISGIPDLFDSESAAGSASARIMEKLWEQLLALSVRRPLVLVIDDIHHADITSKECVLYFARRVRATPILMVLTEDKKPWQPGPRLQAELLRLPNCRIVRVRPLAPREVAALVSRHPDIQRPDEIADVVYRASGGNPLLTRALIDDYRDSPCQANGELTAGRAFDRAVRSCLARCGEQELLLAQVLAVLDAPASTAPLAAMLGVPPDSVTTLLGTLTGAGLVSAGRFRHPAARAAALSMLRPGELARLHAIAARVLHEEDWPASAVAEHLIAARATLDAARHPWAGTALREAADTAVRDGAFAFAVRCLQVLAGLSADPGDRARVNAGVAEARWLAAPASALRHLPELEAAAAEGHLSGREASRAAFYHMWMGRARDAITILKSADVVPGARAPRRDPRTDLLSLSCLYPEFQAQARSLIAAQDPARTPSQSAGPRRQAAELAARVMAGPAAPAMSGPIPVPDIALLDDTALTMVAVAMAVALDSGEPGPLTHWSSAFVEDSGPGLPGAEAGPAGAGPAGRASWRSPMCRALLSAIRAAIHLRLGDLRAAEAEAHEAITEITLGDWGVLAGIPAAVLTVTAIEAGRLDDAAAHLAMPVPAAMFSTVLGPVYLCARGRYHLATSQPRLALRAFEMCGETMAGWPPDQSGFAAWRVGAAEALLRLGSLDRAAGLLAAQRSLLGERQGRAYGSWLRVHAAASPLAARPSLLRESAEILLGHSDPVGAARALSDLSQAHEARGEYRDARRVRRRAWHLSRQSGAARATGFAGGAGESRESREPGDPGERVGAPDEVAAASAGDTTGLSGAERRVASLAADGYTNREIADKLYVTVSTVEQHLTRVYRKLGVNSRNDLGPRLGPVTAGLTPR